MTRWRPWVVVGGVAGAVAVGAALILAIFTSPDPARTGTIVGAIVAVVVTVANVVMWLLRLPRPVGPPEPPPPPPPARWYAWLLGVSVVGSVVAGALSLPRVSLAWAVLHGLGVLLVVQVAGMVAVGVVHLASRPRPQDLVPDSQQVRPAVVVALVVAVVTVVPDSPFSLIPDCIPLEVSSSIEEGKVDTLQSIARDYNAAGRRVDGRCVEVEVHGTTSGRARTALQGDWDEVVPDGVPEPQVWAPTSSMWLELLRNSGTVDGLPHGSDVDSVTHSALVVAMPRDMADVLGWPEQTLTWERIRELSDEGWVAHGGQPEWGDFSFGKDNPHLSTSGLAATVATFYEAARREGMEPPDLDPGRMGDDDIQTFVRGVEAGVHNYEADIIDFLETLCGYDDRGDPHDYVSAVLLQEQLVYEYNQGVYCEDERPPSEALVPFYVQDSVLPLDHPYVVLPSASPAQEEAADDFFDYLRQPAQQDRFAAIGFRSRASQFEPWALTGRVSEVLNGGEQGRRTGMEELDEQSFTPTPSGAVVQAVLESWDDVRKRANILFVLDTSDSMAERLPGGRTRYEVMQATVTRGVRQLLAGPHDAGLWTFPNRDGDDPPYVPHVPVDPVGDTRGDIVAAIEEDLPDPGLGTPIYRTIRDAHEHLVERSRNQDQPRPEIDAIVVVTDGGNNDPRNEDYDLDALLDDIRPQEGEPPVKVFSIAFGSDADFANLRRISDATGGEAYDARDAARLDDVFPQVINNF